MEKILMIDGQQVEFKSTAAFLLRYKAQFKRDAIQDIMAMAEAFDMDGEEPVMKDLSAVDLEVFYNIAWGLAKTANSQIPLPLEWLDTFGEFPLEEIIPEIMDLALSSFSSTKKG